MTDGDKQQRQWTHLASLEGPDGLSVGEIWVQPDIDAQA